MTEEGASPRAVEDMERPYGDALDEWRAWGDADAWEVAVADGLYEPD